MYGHTKTMKALTELIEAFRGTVGVEAQGGWARNPPPCSMPEKWFRPIKLMADLGYAVARTAINDEATHIMEEIEKQVSKLLVEYSVPESVLLGVWELQVLEEWYKTGRITISTKNATTDNTQAKMHVHVVNGELPVKERNVESAIEVRPKLVF